MDTTTTLQLLERWKAKRGLTSDAAAAKALHVSRMAVSSWRSGQRHASASKAAQMAGDLKLDTLQVLAAIEADRSQGEDQRTWQKFGRGAFMALVAGIPLCLLLSVPSTAGVLRQAGAEVVPQNQSYVHRRKRRWQLTRWLPFVRMQKTPEIPGFRVFGSSMKPFSRWCVAAARRSSRSRLRPLVKERRIHAPSGLLHRHRGHIARGFNSRPIRHRAVRRRSCCGDRPG